MSSMITKEHQTMYICPCLQPLCITRLYRMAQRLATSSVPYPGTPVENHLQGLTISGMLEPSVNRLSQAKGLFVNLVDETLSAIVVFLLLALTVFLLTCSTCTS